MYVRLVIFALILAFVIIGLRAVRRNIDNYITKNHKHKPRHERARNKENGIVELKRDPRDGVFRSRKSKENSADRRDTDA